MRPKLYESLSVCTSHRPHGRVILFDAINLLFYLVHERFFRHALLMFGKYPRPFVTFTKFTHAFQNIGVSFNFLRPVVIGAQKCSTIRNPKANI